MTPFGKALRHLRLDLNMLAGEMSSQLRVSPSYLSQIETGKKAIPDGLVDKIISTFNLEKEKAAELHKASAVSRSEFRIDVGNKSSSEDKLLADRISREFARLTPEQKSRLRSIFGKGEI